MFSVNIRGHAGIEAEFVVPSAVLALDLALQADRAGFTWQARDGHESDATADGAGLPLWRLRDLAARAVAAEPGWARHLADILAAEARAAGARLN